MNNTISAQELADLLRTTISGETEGLLTTQDILKEWETAQIDYFEALMEIIQEPVFDNSEKISAAINLRQFLTRKLFITSIPLLSRIKYCEQIFAIVVDTAFPRQLKNSVGAWIPILCTIDETDTKGYAMDALTLLILQALNGPLQRVSGGLHVTGIVFQTIGHSQKVEQLISQLVPPLSVVTQQIKQAFLTESGTLDSFGQLAQVAEEWSTVVHKIVQFWEQSEDLIDYWVHSDSLTTSICEILQLTIRDTQSTAVKLINIGVHEAYASLNSAKTQLLQTVKSFLALLNSKKGLIGEHKAPVVEGELLKNAPIINHLGKLIPIYAESLSIVIKSHRDSLEIDYVHDLVMETFKLLEQITKEPFFYHVIQQIHQKLLVEGWLPLIAMSAEEHETFCTDPGEFVQCTLDYWQDGSSDTIKVAVVKLITVIAQRIDGSLTFITQYLLELLDYTISQNEPNSLINYRHISQSYAIGIVSLPDDERVILSLVTLVTLQRPISQRQDLLREVVDVINLHWHTFMQITNEMVQSHMCLFAQFFTDKIYRIDPKLGENLWAYLDRALDQSEVIQISAYSAFKSLIKSKIDQPINPILLKLFSRLDNSYQLSFFDLLFDIIKVLPLPAGNIAEAFARLTQKLSLVFLHHPPNWRLMSEKIINIWLELIDKNSDNIYTWQPAIEQALYPIVALLKNPTNYNLEDRLISIWHRLVMITGRFDQHSIDLISVFPMVVKKSHRDIASVYKYIITAFKLGSSLLKEIQLQWIVALATNSVVENCIDQVDMCRGWMIFELVLSVPNLPEGVVDHIIRTCISRLHFGHEFTEVRVINVVLMGVYKYPSKTMELLQAHANLNKLLDKIIQRGFFGSENDQKLIIAAICRLLLLETMPNALSFRLLDLFRRLVLIFQETPTTLPGKKAQILDTTNGTMAEQKKQQSIQSMKNEVLLSMHHFPGTLKQIDEYQVLRHTLEEVRGRSLQALRILLEKLSSVEKAILQKILSCQRVQVSNTVSEGRQIARPRSLIESYL